MSARIPFAALQANTLVQGRQRKTNQGGGKHPSHPTELTATKENGSLHPQRDRQIPPASANCNGSKNSWSVKPTPSSIAQDNTTTHWSSAEVERTARRSFRDVVAASRKSSRSSIHLGGRNTSWEVLSRPESSHQSFIISRQTQAPLRNDDEVASCGIGSTGGAASPEQSQQAPFVGSTAAPSTDVGQARPEVDDELDCAQDTPLQHGFDASQDLLSPRPAEQDNRLSEKEILLGIYPSPDSLPRSEAAPCNDTGSSGIASDGSCEQRSAVPLVPLTQTSSGPASLSRLSPDSPCGLHRLTGSSLDYTSTHEVKVAPGTFCIPLNPASSFPACLLLPRIASLPPQAHQPFVVTCCFPFRRDKTVSKAALSPPEVAALEKNTVFRQWTSAETTQTRNLPPQAPPPCLRTTRT